MMTVIEKQYMDAVIAMNRRLQSSQPDWEQRRYEIAKDAMCAILCNPAIVDKVTEEGEPAWGAPVAIAKTAVTLAGLLVEELKKQKSDD
ncbi:hypothetical protein [uncultured Muribaculum sp.]|uniref:hypothetical protein n=1 Tax=uncultured Muribaculum sp. TaxID=1918613 RepID=UPI0026770F7A|nr:hypothetical protein [uncultured Muribaculum sp.]